MFCGAERRIRKKKQEIIYEKCSKFIKSIKQYHSYSVAINHASGYM